MKPPPDLSFWMALSSKYRNMTWNLSGSLDRSILEACSDITRFRDSAQKIDTIRTFSRWAPKIGVTNSASNPNQSSIVSNDQSMNLQMGGVLKSFAFYHQIPISSSEFNLTFMLNLERKLVLRTGAWKDYRWRAGLKINTKPDGVTTLTSCIPVCRLRADTWTWQSLAC